jgi:hypothetical protein
LTCLRAELPVDCPTVTPFTGFLIPSPQTEENEQSWNQEGDNDEKIRAEVTLVNLNRKQEQSERPQDSQDPKGYLLPSVNFHGKSY